MNNTRMGTLPLLMTLVMVGPAPATQLSTAEPRPLGRDLPNASLPRADESTVLREFVEPAGNLSLREALVAALTNSPELATFSWKVRAKEAEAIQAGLRPNVELILELENFGGKGDLDGLGGSETTIALSQLIELGGKRGKRLATAEYDRELAAWDYEVARIDVLTKTTKSFLEVLHAQEEVALAEELVQIAEEVLASVSRRVKAGSTSPVEESRARVELETSRIDREQADRRLAAVRRELSAAWGESTPAFSEALGNLEEIASPPSLKALKGRIEQNPDLARWASELDYRRAALDLERSRGLPDLSIGAGVRYLNEIDGSAFIIEFGLPLPIFDRNQGASLAAEMRVRQVDEERRATAVRLQTRLAISHGALLAARSEIYALRDRALPEAETAFRSAQEAYFRGSMRFTDVLDTERLLFELRSRYFSTLARYHSTVADLERLIGEPLQISDRNPGRHYQ